MSARDEILARIGAALADAPEVAPPPARPVGRPGADLDLFEARLRDYRTEVHRIDENAIAATVAEICRDLGCARLGAPPELPDAWRPVGVELVVDAGLEPSELDRLDGVLTGATLAIAETGTIVLSGSAADGRRALSLVPDLHICVVHAGQVVADVAAAFEQLTPLVVDERRPLTFISGPSATSDIELDRVEGVHGPRRLVAVIASENA